MESGWILTTAERREGHAPHVDSNEKVLELLLPCPRDESPAFTLSLLWHHPWGALGSSHSLLELLVLRQEWERPQYFQWCLLGVKILLYKIFLSSLLPFLGFQIERADFSWGSFFFCLYLLAFPDCWLLQYSVEYWAMWDKKKAQIAHCYTMPSSLSHLHFSSHLSISSYVCNFQIYNILCF